MAQVEPSARVIFGNLPIDKHATPKHTTSVSVAHLAESVTVQSGHLPKRVRWGGVNANAQRSQTHARVAATNVMLVIMFETATLAKDNTQLVNIP